jgi:hypothetical protein
MKATIYKALLDGIRNTTEYELGHIEVLYTNADYEVIIIPGDDKDQMNIPDCINIAKSMGLSGYLAVLDGKPAIYIY